MKGSPSPCEPTATLGRFSCRPPSALRHPLLAPRYYSRPLTLEALILAKTLKLLVLCGFLWAIWCEIRDLLG